MPADCIETLSSPPSFPSLLDSPPSIPPEIKIIKLKRINANPLISKTYDSQLFERVEVYFRRFFHLSDSSLSLHLDEVEVILNPEVEKRFKEAEEEMHQKYEGKKELEGETQSELQQYYLKHLLKSDNLIERRNSNAISAWHGTNDKKKESISWYGMLNLSTTDPGYYGKAMYFTQHPKYGEYYANACKKTINNNNNNGSFQLFLCWVLLGKPFATTKVFSLPFLSLIIISYSFLLFFSLIIFAYSFPSFVFFLLSFFLLFAHAFFLYYFNLFHYNTGKYWG